jgi:hypothetical protein
MDKEQVPLLPAEELPQTDPAKPKKEKVNCLQDMMIEIMNERKIELAEIQRETGIPWGTLYAWYSGEVSAQLLDRNILKLAQFFNVSIHYLGFGIGEDENVFEKGDKI